MTRSLFAVGVLLALLPGAVAAQTGFEFMPDGGRNLVIQAFGANPETLAGVAERKADADGWRVLLKEQAPDFSAAQVDTLASYLALNLPLANAAALRGMTPEQATRTLPLDGKELAIRHCQFCHGFYTAYLGHDRDLNGWLVVFNSPFHMEIAMNPTERQTFASYSAINLPIPFEDVPPDFRY